VLFPYAHTLHNLLDACTAILLSFATSIMQTHGSVSLLSTKREEEERKTLLLFGCSAIDDKKKTLKM